MKLMLQVMTVMPSLMTRLQAVTVSCDDARMIVTSAVNEISGKISHSIKSEYREIFRKV